MTLKKGMTGLHVQGLQELLHIYPDGKFGPLTEEAVKEFQKAHGLVADGIVGEKTWAALKSAEKGELKKSTRTINEIIVHCSATPEGKDYTLDTIRQWHRQRGLLSRQWAKSTDLCSLPLANCSCFPLSPMVPAPLNWATTSR